MRLRMTAPALACALAAFILPAIAQAQTVPAKPGLWASASQAVLNGKPLPTIFDIHGIPEGQKTQLRQAMSQAGLPAGWNPSITCEKATQVDLQTILGQMKAEGCNSEITSNTGGHITGKVQCKSAQGAGSGTVDVSGVGSSQLTYVLNMTGTFNGAPMNYKATTISKFIGSDCSRLPPGVDESMVSEQ